MNKYWFLVYISTFFEVSWVTGLKHATTGLEWAGTVICILVSFYLLITATKKLPISTVYAVFTGLGAAGTVIVELVLFSNEVNWLKLILCAVLITGVVGLKMVTTEPGQPVKGEN